MLRFCRRLAREGVDFECVSPGEVEWLEQAIGPGYLIPTESCLPQTLRRSLRYEWALNKGLQVTLDNLYPTRSLARIVQGETAVHSTRPRPGSWSSRARQDRWGAFEVWRAIV